MNTSNLLKKISFLALTASSLCFTTETFAQHGRRDRREDVRDAQFNGGRRDKREDVRDRREDKRDHREDKRDRKEDRRDRRH